MASVLSIGNQHQQFSNQQLSIKKVVSATEKGHNQALIQHRPIISVGDSHAQTQADDIFMRADAYANLSLKAQKMLNAYEGVTHNEKREALHSMIGVDVFA